MHKNFDVLDFFFDWNGRISRKEYWLGLLALSLLSMPFAVVLFFVLLSSILGVTDYSYNVSISGLFIYFMPAMIFLSILSFAKLVLYIKRYHDRDKSGHWLWISLIPYIGAIWVLIEAGFFRGTIGENKFGADPVSDK